jgi:3-(3-hydroxy-phenyl)propionate hydroxylase
VLQDTENALHFWFQRTRADWVLVRPDRYVAALGRSADAADALGRFAARFVPGAIQMAAQPTGKPSHAPGAILNGAQP